MTTPHRSPWRDALIVFCLIGVIVSGFLTWQSVENDSRQDRVEALREKARDKEISDLLGCFDRFAEQLAGGLPLVREASVVRSDALRAGITKLREVLTLALGPDVPEEKARRVFAELVKALTEFEEADDEVKHVQKENPYPPAPSEFCEETP